MPVETEIKPIERTVGPTDEATDHDDLCEDHAGYQDPIKGGHQIQDGCSDKWGTVGIVAWNDYQEKVVTALHVTEKCQTVENGGIALGSGYTAIPPQDVISYNLDSSRDATAGEVVDGKDITGAWTFDGLSDRVSGSNSSMWAGFRGAASCFEGDHVVKTSKSDQVEYEADFENEYADNGDSGGPWVDGDNKLVVSQSPLEFSSNWFP